MLIDQLSRNDEYELPLRLRLERQLQGVCFIIIKPEFMPIIMIDIDMGIFLGINVEVDGYFYLK